MIVGIKTTHILSHCDNYHLPLSHTFALPFCFPKLQNGHSSSSYFISMKEEVFSTNSLPSTADRKLTPHAALGGAFWAEAGGKLRSPTLSMEKDLLCNQKLYFYNISISSFSSFSPFLSSASLSSFLFQPVLLPSKPITFSFDPVHLPSINSWHLLAHYPSYL